MLIANLLRKRTSKLISKENSTKSSNKVKVINYARLETYKSYDLNAARLGCSITCIAFLHAFHRAFHTVFWERFKDKSVLLRLFPGNVCMATNIRN